MSITQSTAGAGGGEYILVSRTMLDRVRRRLALQTAAQSGRYGDAELCAVLSDFDAALASAPPAGQGNGASAGWKLVPVEPTEEMLKAFWAAGLRGSSSEAYIAMLASAPPAPTPDAGATQIAEGCCSAVSPCSHQQRDPATLCAICAKAARLTDQILGAEEARDLAASERISAAQAIYDEWMADYDPHAPDHEVHLFDAMKAAIAVADAHGSARGGEMKHGYQPTRQGSERPDPPKSGSAVIPPRRSAPTPEAGQGEPVAWAWERQNERGVWCPRTSHAKPGEHSWHRNIRPLFATPAPSRPGDRAGLAQSHYELLRECQSEFRVLGCKGLVETIEAQCQRHLALRDAPRDGGVGTQAARDVLAERRRQIEAEGYSAGHDDAMESEGQLAGAAACYAFGDRLWVGESNGVGYLRDAATVWPWAESYWKPTDRRRDLVKAGALILAEIERLDRLPSPNAGDVTQPSGEKKGGR